MVRMEEQRPEVHAAAANLLSTGAMPALLFSETCTVNPAILCCMHASSRYTPEGVKYLPTPVYDAVHTVARSSPANLSDPGRRAPEIGQVWWLSEEDQPYLAEVFVDGKVPGSRLPHLDRKLLSQEDKHVARSIGVAVEHTKLIDKTAPMCLYCPWCAPSDSILWCAACTHHGVKPGYKSSLGSYMPPYCMSTSLQRHLEACMQVYDCRRNRCTRVCQEAVQSRDAEC
jgi:hypothetical protein